MSAININKKSLDFVINRTRNKKYWNEIDVDNWRFKGLSSYLKKNDDKKNKIKFSKFFKINSDLVYNKKLKYIIFGKGM